MLERDDLARVLAIAPEPVRAHRQPRPDPVRRTALSVRSGVAAECFREYNRDHRHRETRHTQPDRSTWSSGYIEGGYVVLYAGTQYDLVSVGLEPPPC